MVRNENALYNMLLQAGLSVGFIVSLFVMLVKTKSYSGPEIMYVKP